MSRIAGMLLAAVMAFGTVSATQVMGQTEPGANSTTDVFRPAAVFTDHMVLQRTTEVPVWGWGTTGDVISISLKDAPTTGTNSARAITGPDGKWTAKLGPFAAGGPYELVIQGPQRTVTFKDVLIGEVWFCSGQSNMDWQVKQALNPEKEIAESANKQIRLFQVARYPRPHEQSDLKDAVGWSICGPETVPTFSAVGYYFGRDIQKRLGVPIGLIHSAFGGTPAESWTSKEGLAEFASFREALDEMANEPREPEAAKKQFELRLARWQDEQRLKDPGAEMTGTGWAWAAPDADESGWETLDLPKKWDDADLMRQFDGAVWFRREFNIPAAGVETTATLMLGGIDDHDITWVNGTEVGKSENVFANRRYRVAGDLLKPGRNVLVIRVMDTGGAGGFSAKPEDFRLQWREKGSTMSVSLAGPWKYRQGVDLKQLPPRPLDPLHPWRPSSLYNGMVAPVVPFAIRGAIWYQGESNAGRAQQYRTLFPAMIRDWRKNWDQGEFPFLFVQLANFMKAKGEPSEDEWAELRDAQFQTLKAVPNTAMASAIDIGEANDIHPKNKQEVGRRLALGARALAYGEGIEWSGPLYREAKREGNALRISFDHTSGGLVARGGPLREFAIAGDDREFVWAEARIDGDSVVVSSEKVAAPVAVRYSWQSNPEANLYNGEGLPASPFRTDDWPGITAGE